LPGIWAFAEVLPATLIVLIDTISGQTRLSGHGESQTYWDVISRSLPVDSAFGRYRLSVTLDLNTRCASWTQNVIKVAIHSNRNSAVALAKRSATEGYGSVKILGHDDPHHGFASAAGANGFTDEQQSAPSGTMALVFRMHRR
jgi:hypothetical protein